jgi:WD40 repeat protein
MLLILNTRLSVSLLTVLFLALILAVYYLRPAVPGYALLVDDWDTVGAGIMAEQINIAFHLVSIPDGVHARRFYGVGKWAETIIASPDNLLGILKGAEVAFPQTGNIIQLWDDKVRTLTFDQALREPNVWSPDSRYLTVGVNHICSCDKKIVIDLGVVDANTGQLRVLTDGEFVAQDDRSVVWSPDGNWLIYVNQQFDPGQPRIETVKIIPVNGDQPPRTLFTRTGVLTPGLWLRWLPDGEQIALTSFAMSEIWFVDIQTTQVSFHYIAVDYFDSCWSPDTNHFIIISKAGFELITPDGLLPLDTSFVDPSLWKQKAPTYDGCAWSPDGKKLVLIYADHPAPPVIQLLDFENRKVTELRIQPEARFLFPSWSLDSRLLALKTYRPILDSGDTYVYDTAIMQQIFYRPHANFLAWIPNPA